MSWIEGIATAAGVACVLLLVMENIWNFPFGIVQVLLSAYVFYTQRLYSDVILQIFFVVLNVYGWIHWTRRGELPQLPVTRMSRLAIVVWSVITIVMTGVWGTFAKVQLNAAAPYVDGFILIASLVAQWLTARKHIESWWFWIIVDLVAIPLYASRGLYFFAGLYVVFLILCIMGLKEWKRSMTAAAAVA
jgi:nicotinamide mononucleotide transporter